jgi:hypothetical protein
MIVMACGLEASRLLVISPDEREKKEFEMVYIAVKSQQSGSEREASHHQ